MSKKKNRAEVTLKEFMAGLPDLKVTARQREFIKAAFRALLTVALEKRFGARVDI